MRYATFTSVAGGCALAVASGGGSGSPDPEDETSWLRCDEGRAQSLEAVFEVAQAGAGRVSLKSVASGYYAEMVPPTSKRLGWVVRATRKTPDDDAALFEALDKTYLRGVAAGGMVTAILENGERRPSNPIRGHGNKPRNKGPGGKDPLSAWTWTWLDADAVAAARRRADEERAEQEKLLSALPPPPSANSTEKRVIAYGLYGSDPKYCTGAIRNSELVHEIFPGWVARFYYREDVPAEVLSALKKNGAELVAMHKGSSTTKGNIAGMFWRFLVADDPTVDRYIVRDSDSRLNAREAHAVAEWIASGKGVHTIRDHPNHDRPLNGGLWGGVKGAFPRMSEEVKAFSNKQSYGGDLQFLNTVVWPRVKNNQIGHDAYTCTKYPNSKPFPTKRPENYQHVGQVFSASDQSRARDINGYMRGRKTPKPCRKRDDWWFG